MKSIHMYMFIASCEKPTGKTPAPKQWHVSTVAGSDTWGDADAKGINAQFYFPSGIAVSSDGTLYVADTYNDRIRKIDRLGVVTTIAGSTKGYKDATGEAARFDFPNGIAVSPDGNTLYVADTKNHRIRKIDTSGGVTTIAGSIQGYKDAKGINAQFDSPYGIAVSSDGSTLYVADPSSHRIRKIDISSKEVTTIAGGIQGYKDAKGINAQFDSPYGISCFL